MAGADTLYESFRGRSPGKRARVGVRFGRRWLTAVGDSNILIPESLATMGHVVALEYDTTRDGKTVRARHEFTAGSRPLLLAGERDGEVFLVGDRFRFTDRGIMDIGSDGRLIDGKLRRSPR